MLGDVLHELGGQTHGGDELELVSVQQQDLHSLAPAQQPRALRDRGEHGSGVRGRAAESDEHRIRGRELLGDIPITE